MKVVFIMENPGACKWCRFASKDKTPGCSLKPRYFDWGKTTWAGVYARCPLVTIPEAARRYPEEAIKEKEVSE